MVKFVSQPLELYNTGTADALYLESSDAGTLAGPVITLKRNSPSPAQADYLGQLKFKGESDSGVERVYAKITAKIDDATNGAEDGIIEFMNRFGGSEQIALRLKEDSFRTLNGVELHVDGNTGLGNNNPSEKLDVTGNIAVSGTVDGRDVGTDGTNQDALQTLTGVSAAATDLGTFTGSTIADNVTVKDALQDLEDAAIPSGGTNGFILAKASGDDYDTEWIPQTTSISSVSQDSNPALGGNLDGSSNDISGVNAYSGASLSLTGNITVDGTVDGRDVATDGTNQDALQTLTGIAAGTSNLGTFTGSTIADSLTIKAALQALETAVESSTSSSDHGALTGLGDDDHPQYLLADGTRSVSGDLDVTGDVTIGGQVEIPRSVSYGTRHLGTFYPLAGLGSASQRIFGDLVSNTGKRYQITLSTGDLEMMTNAANVIFKNGALNAETLRILSDGTLQPAAGVTTNDLGSSSRKWRDVWLSGDITVDGTVDGRDVAADGTNQDSLQTLTGIAAGTTDLGTFTGTTIADNSTIKAALQALETKAEASIGASAVSYSTQEAIYDGATEVGTALDNLANGLGSLATKSTITNADISLNAVGLSKIAQIGPETILGNSSTFANGSPSALDATQVSTILGLGDLATEDDAASDGTKYTRQDGAWVAADSTLADANQTITASRTIDDGDNGYQFFVDLNNGGASTAQLLVNPTTPQVTLSANNGTNTFIVQNSGAAVNFICSPTSTVQLNSDPGADGECFISQGASAAPVYSGFPMVRSSTAPSNTNMLWYNTTEKELFTYDSGRGHWFGQPYYISMGKTTSTTAGTGHFLYVGHQGTAATSSERGWLVPHDMTITGLRGHTQSTFDGWTFRVDKSSGGTNTTGVVSTGTLGAVDTYSDFTIDVDLAAADIIGIAGVLGSVTLNNTTFTIEVRRRL